MNAAQQPAGGLTTYSGATCEGGCTSTNLVSVVLADKENALREAKDGTHECITKSLIQITA